MKHVGRKAVVIAQKSRRGIPLHWNERHQGKSWRKDTMTRRMENEHNRSAGKHKIRSYNVCTESSPVQKEITNPWWSADEDFVKSPIALDWEGFVPYISKHDWLD